MLIVKLQYVEYVGQLYTVFMPDCLRGKRIARWKSSIDDANPRIFGLCKAFFGSHWLIRPFFLH